MTEEITSQKVLTETCNNSEAYQIAHQSQAEDSVPRTIQTLDKGFYAPLIHPDQGEETGQHCFLLLSSQTWHLMRQ
jgi:hypothetical protein